ncbi:ESPR domain-containing protein [Actinobacillus arthritidis]|uniref:ESPR domain-containing protein n=1 Tax=Actinobacillus arthritidis TaxID=157339 RepID=UPI00244128B1|nr:ESPR domain-containing protein [Actinobacillus arthritidis]WGE88985.1 ESPR domain-containing protein [Actinobacillus arthritidis]
MNKIFRVIWNEATQSWIAVSELAKGKVKSSSSNTTTTTINRSNKALWIASTLGLLSALGSNQANAAIEIGSTSGISFAQNGAATPASSLSIAIGQNAKITGETATHIIDYLSPANKKRTPATNNYYILSTSGVAIGHSSSVTNGGTVVGSLAKSKGLGVAVGAC